MKVYKEKQYLIFELEDGRICKYDFATQSAIGFKGKSVKDLRTQLSNITMDDIIDCCIDKKYAQFLQFIQNCEIHNISNIGTILSKIPNYSRFEQFFSAGLGDNVSVYLTKSINEVPNALLKVARDSDILITNNLCDWWGQNPNAYNLAFNIKYKSLNVEDVKDILTTSRTTYRRGISSIYNILLRDYGYSAKALLIYIDNLKTYEALDNIRFVMQELYDYVMMMQAISPKYDKYPKNFLTTHKIACRNYERLKKEFSEQAFQRRINKSFECTFKDYVFIYPNSTQDIKDEACMQSNCVASYIDNVIDGDCHIMFLRKKDNPKESLVTIEVCDNQIVQAKRKYNADITEQDQEAINYWNNKFN